MSVIDELLVGFRDYLLLRSDLMLQHFIAGFHWPTEERSLASRDLPVVTYLREFEQPVNGAEGALCDRLHRSADLLHWAQTYSIADFGSDFLQRYGWVELFGTRGHFASEEMAGGFLLLGPNVHYPDHHHEAEEIYIPLTDGSLWSKDAQPFLPRWSGEIIHHPSNIRHAVRTEEQPLVALYLWRGGPLAQKSIISGRMQ
jgi:hypothetical protein